MAMVKLEPAFHVLPGRAIGPVRLGMARADVDALGDRRAREIEAHFDAEETCCRIAARVPTHPYDVPQFFLSGMLLNGLTCPEVDALFESLAGHLCRDHAFTEAPSVGLVGVRWTWTDRYAWVEVVPPVADVVRAGGPVTRAASVFVEIIPGRRVGPVSLGMTEAEFRAVEAQADGVQPWFEVGRCHKILALVPWNVGQAPFFKLGGRVLNGLWAEQVDEVLAGFGRLKHSYGGVDVPTAGIGATKWENIDESYHCIDVVAPKPD